MLKLFLYIFFFALPLIGVGTKPTVIRSPRKIILRHEPSWTYKGVIAGDKLRIKNVYQIPSGILIDINTGKILWSKHSKEKKEIASMTKMMTVLLAIEAVNRGEISLHERIQVSKAAAKLGGSQVFLDPKENFSLAELLKTIMIVSANDSAYLVAETIGGNVGSFVNKMNQRAKQLGMNNTRFLNPHGLPIRGNGNISCAYDMAILANELLKYPQVVTWASTWIDSIRKGKFQLVNHNKLVKTCNGVDGMKTGYYKKAGFCVAATANRQNRRFVAVVIGAKSKTLRNNFVKNLLDWGEKNF